MYVYRCAVKYGSKQSNLIRVKFGIVSDVYKLLRTAYPYLHWRIGNNCLLERSHAPTRSELLESVGLDRFLELSSSTLMVALLVIRGELEQGVFLGIAMVISYMPLLRHWESGPIIKLSLKRLVLD